MKICKKCKIDKDESEFNPKKCMCKDCNKSYQKWHYQNNKKYYYKKSKKSRKKNRLWLRELKKNLSCKNCGENHPATLAFHHINPLEKYDEVSSMISSGSCSRAKILAEIAKCIVLCHNCHAILHDEERENWHSGGDSHSPPSVS